MSRNTLRKSLNSTLASSGSDKTRRSVCNLLPLPRGEVGGHNLATSGGPDPEPTGGFGVQIAPLPFLSALHEPMVSVASRPAGRSTGFGEKSGVARDLGVALPVVLGTAGATSWLLGLPGSYLVVAVAIYLVIAGLILALIPSGAPGPGMGAANRVTLGRAALSVPLGALCLPLGPLPAEGYWWVIVLATVVMILDGADGRIARSTGTQTGFGARFDMEVDAALILALSVLVWAGGRVGAWCLLIGLMRYAFVAASRLWPVLGRELPESRRRKAVCVLQGVVLLVAMGPVIPDALATAVVGAGLAALVSSFTVDVRWLLEG